MLEINLNPFPELTTSRLLLRQLSLDDAEEIFQLRSDKEVSALIDRPIATSIDDAREFINKIIAARAMFWVIALKDNPKLIGTIMYWNMVKERETAEIGYELLPQYHGKGIMQEALVKVIEFGFNTLDLKTIVAELKAINEPSVKLLEKRGFIKKSVIENGYVIYELHH